MWLDKILLGFAALGVVCLVISITFLVVMRKAGHTPVKLVRYNFDCLRIGHQPSGGHLPPYNPNDDHIRVMLSPGGYVEASADLFEAIPTDVLARMNAVDPPERL